MCATLDLDSHDGDMEFLADLDRIFAIRLRQGDVDGWKTLGDVERTVARLVPVVTGGACPTAMVFHRLRHALMQRGRRRGDLTPATRLDELAHGHPARLLRSLAKTSGLAVPMGQPRLPGTIGAYLCAFALIVAGVMLLTSQWLLAGVATGAMAAGYWLAMLDSGVSGGNRDARRSCTANGRT